MLHEQPRLHATQSVLVQIEVDGVSRSHRPAFGGSGDRLEGQLAIPPQAIGLVVFAHGSGSSRHSPRNKLVARTLRENAHAATLLVDLLTGAEDQLDQRTGELRFDIPLLADRVSRVCDWTRRDFRTRRLPLGLFGASTGAAAALLAASREPDRIAAVVSRGGRPDLAGAAALAGVVAPTLLIVGGEDTVVLDLNRSALEAMTSAKCRLEIVLGASHLFEEPGTLDEAAGLSAEWFARWLPAR